MSIVGLRNLIPIIVVVLIAIVWRELRQSVDMWFRIAVLLRDVLLGVAVLNIWLPSIIMLQIALLLRLTMLVVIFRDLIVL